MGVRCYGSFFAAFRILFMPADAGPADMATDAMVGTAFDEVTGATDTMVTLSGEASMASAAMTGAEFATGFGEAKFAYDFATYAGAYAGCAMGLF